MQPRCFLCDDPHGKLSQRGDFVVDVQCNRCGTYQMRLDAAHVLSAELKDRRHLVSGYCRQVDIEIARRVRTDRPLLTADNVRTMIDTAPADPLAKAEALLVNMVNQSAFFGDKLGPAPELDYPLGYCQNMAEFNRVLLYLIEEGLLDRNGPLHVSMRGWIRSREVQQASRSSTQAFVAMSFAKELDACFDNGIKPAITEAGYSAYRSDREESVEKIDDHILFQIKRSRFLVADFTDQRQGVYFEAGYAMGLGIPVIWTCSRIDSKNLHFDTRQYNHILWDSAAKLKDLLFHRIKVLIG